MSNCLFVCTYSRYSCSPNPLLISLRSYLRTNKCHTNTHTHTCNIVRVMQTLQIPVFRNDEEFLTKLAIKHSLFRKGGEPDILMVARTFLQNLGKNVPSPSCLPPAKSKSRFELPEWFKKLDLAKVRGSWSSPSSSL